MLTKISAFWMEFKNKRNTDTNIKAELLGMPVRPHFAPNGKMIQIPGRDGFLWQDYDSAKPDTLTVKLAATKDSNLATLNAWLSGSGNLVFSDDPSHYYRASVLKSYTMTPINNRFREPSFTVKFDVQPYRYLTEPANKPTLTAEGYVSNRGTQTCFPLIKVTPSSANWALTIAGCRITCTGRNNPTYIDCELQDCFNSDFSGLVNDKVKIPGGKYPVLVSGTNLISDFENITKVEFTEMRERDA